MVYAHISIYINSSIYINQNKLSIISIYLVQSSTNPNEQRKLTLFKKQVEELVALMNLNIDLNSASETEITLAILKENKPVTITYDLLSNKIQTIAI